MLDLKETRGEIDRVDKQIIELFEERMELCKEVAEYKLYTGKPVLDRKRELEKIAVLKSMSSDEFYAHSIEELFEQIMSMSRKLQYKLLTEEGINNDIGFIKEIFFASPTNKVLRINIDNKEILVPYQKEFITNIDKLNQMIYIKVIDGMIL